MSEKNHNNNTSEIGWNLQHTYATLPEALFRKVDPEIPIKPEIVFFNNHLSERLGLKFSEVSEQEIADFFSGKILPPGSVPIAQAYAGHQFGHFTMLGDGRAILFGEQLTPDGTLIDLVWKGSGRTPFSRSGDGLGTLSAMTREFLISKAMFGLGIPTTESLAVVKTGKKVYREKIHEGAVLTRTALSHIRVGTFEFVSYYTDKATLMKFTDYCIQRHYPESLGDQNSVLSFYKKVIQKQLDLILHWMRVGFIHGVMNTDNMSIAGETIDYGPCAFMNEYSPDTVFSSIDSQGRYAFGNQPRIGHWNLACLGSALLPILSDNEEEAKEMISEALNEYIKGFEREWPLVLFKKIGISNPEEKNKILLDRLLKWMNETRADYTNTFLKIMGYDVPDHEKYDTPGFQDWIRERKIVLEELGITQEASMQLMQKMNPVIIPRNHLVEKALDGVVGGDVSFAQELLQRLDYPYRHDDVDFKFMESDDRDYKTYCGT
jgi:serine/tyrosine/threonine adenylyltransferase